MISEEKIRELHRQLKKGEPEGEIRERLKKEGHTPEEIQQVFKPQPYDMRSWYLVFGVLITIAGVYYVNSLGGLMILLLGLFLLYSYIKETERLKRRPE
ncbi:MAG: hypothetical protein HZA79_14995 [Sphingobacteriales bacterium]|nr:hypothetical protein [Sphingobacteriales bacterium]